MAALEMRQFIINHIINGKPFKSAILLYSPLIIGFVLTFVQITILGNTSIFPFIVYFFPFPFLLLLLLWLETVYLELLKRIDFLPNLKSESFRKIVKFSIWTLSILSIQILFTELIVKIDFPSLPNWIMSFLIGIYTIEMICMIIAYIGVYYASNFVGKVIAVVDLQAPFESTTHNHRKIKMIGNIFGYSRRHKKIRELINNNAG